MGTIVSSTIREGRKPKIQSGPLTKKLEDGAHPADHFLIVGDKKDVMTWSLAIKDIKGQHSLNMIGAAWAALTHPRGFRGKRWEGPAKIRAWAVDALRRLYHQLGRKAPDERKNRRFSAESDEVTFMALYSSLKPHFSESGPSEFRGTAWDVTIIGAESLASIIVVDSKDYILSKNKRLYSAQGVKESASQWNGVKVYDNHLNPDEFAARAGQRSVRDEWVGALRDTHWVQESYRLDAVLKIVDLPLAAKLMTAWEEDVLGEIGLSIDTFPVYADQQSTSHEGVEMPMIEGFETIVSVDLVAEPAAGGRLNRILASVGADLSLQQEDNEMNEEEIRALVESILTSALPGQVAEAVESAVEGLAPAIQEAVRTAVAEAGNEQEQEESDPQDDSAEQDETDAGNAEESRVEALIEQFESRLAESEASRVVIGDQVFLTERLAQPDVAVLPVPMVTLIRESFDGAIDRDGLEAFIGRVREGAIAQDTTGRIEGAGHERESHLQVTYDQADKWEMTLLAKMMWGSRWSDVRKLESVEDEIVKDRMPEAFRAWIKAGRPKISRSTPTRELALAMLGGNPFDPRETESITTGTLASAMKNTINLRIAADYAVRERWWDPIVREETVDTIEDATLVRVYGLTTLDEVAEGGVYTQKTMEDEEETASYYKRGNTVGITMESLLKDRMSVLRQIPEKLASAWWNTLSDLVSNVFTVNSNTGPVLASTGALFNATSTGTTGGHTNLLTTGLSGAAFDAARLAMNKQTDGVEGAGRRLMIEPKYLLIPLDLRATAKRVFLSPNLAGTANNDINPWEGMVEPLVVPQWTDVNDWALVADPVQWPAIWLLFLSGMQAPAIFTAGDESSGSMFTTDTLLYKIRQIAFRYSSTYDCAPIADPRPLHKSNV